MATLLVSKAVIKRDRTVSNGGLGGCIQLGPQKQGNEMMSRPTWPLRRKVKPLAVDVSFAKDDFTFSTMTPGSVVVHDITLGEGFGSPVTDYVNAAHSDEEAIRCLSAAERHEIKERSSVIVNRPQTPPTPEQTTPLPIELPGSILLPSQGFPQADPPVTPARDKIQARPRDESRRSSTPSLDTSSTTETDMDIFKHLTSPPKQSHRANTSSSAPVNSTSKPFTAMSVEELMQCLPDLTMSVVSHNWVPAMEGELKRIKSLLQEAAEVRLESQTDMKNFGNDVNSIAVSARDISRTYFDAMQRVRPLADRDAKVVSAELDFNRAELHAALAVIDEKKNIISDKDEVIQRLHETIAANARTFGGFIQDHVGNRLNNLHDIRTQEILQLVEDQQQDSSESGAHATSRYVRMPEKQYVSHLQDLRDAQRKVEAYSNIVTDQLDLIKSQSAELDKRMEGYGEYMTLLEDRQARIAELESKIEASEMEMNVAKGSLEAYKALKVTHETLGKHCGDLEWTLQHLKSGYQSQVEARDTEIFNLRQQLGDAVMEVAAHKAEAKTAIPQTANLGAPSRFRKPLNFGRNPTTQERNLPIHARRSLLGGRLPASQSMLSLNTSQTIAAPDKPSAHRNTPSPLSDTMGSSSGDPFGDQGSGRWLSGLRMNPPEASSPSRRASNLHLMIRPRKESLHATSAANGVTGAGPAAAMVRARQGRPSSMLLVDREKALPKPPPMLQSRLQPANDADETGGTDEDDHAYSVTVQMHHPTPTTPIISPQRKGARVLSGITERSVEDANHATNSATTAQAGAGAEGVEDKDGNSSTPISTSSSDKNAFRSSMAMLDRFYETQNDHVDAGQATSPVRATGHGTGKTRGRGRGMLPGAGTLFAGVGAGAGARSWPRRGGAC